MLELKIKHASSGDNTEVDQAREIPLTAYKDISMVINIIVTHVKVSNSASDYIELMCV